MDSLATLILTAGRSAVELSLFVLLPIMVVMLSLMLWLESRGLVSLLADRLAPLLLPLGIAGLGVFALIQEMFVSSTAPLATIALMAKRNVSPRHLTATLAMVMSLAQANVVFPLAAAGLQIGSVIVIAIAGGLVAAAITYHLFGRNLPATSLTSSPDSDVDDYDRRLLAIIRRAGQDAWNITIGAMPLLIVTLVLVSLLRASGAIDWLESQCSWLFELIGFPSATLLLAITKFVAGGTAVLGILMEQYQSGELSSRDINLLAGLLISPLDLAGVAIFATAGKQVAAVIKVAVLGAIVGILFRLVCHVLMFH
ncbi:nucleoside recognition family protein [Oceanobacter mangrovi]|uniref:nucleoside recognition family protein n=1 Tax=Oceanobacter mangrovi TaxID=2862510 RepID=UPI001C8DFB3B|nr:nucleoside recognition family protein [Oceanobacter mangrovi]